MKILPLLLMFVSATLCTPPRTADGRALPHLTYETLVAQSDVVAILEPIANTAAKDQLTEGERSSTDFDATETRFKVLAVFRGEVAKEITLLHFSYSSRVGVVINGASFVRFEVPEKRYPEDNGDAGNYTWLAFLKKRPDGRFEPATGQYDSNYSFRAMRPAPRTLP